MKFALGKKLGMTTIYNEDGAQNVTLVEVASNKVSKICTEDRDGYRAVCVEAPRTRKRTVAREFRAENTEDFSVGQDISVSIFEEGDTVRVSAPTKAKGFQGVVKRHNFKGGPASHGHRHCLRAPGSIGSAYPQHVMKGMRMAGRDGGKRATVPSLKVVAVDADNNTIALKGSVPGVAGRVVEVVSI